MAELGESQLIHCFICVKSTPGLLLGILVSSQCFSKCDPREDQSHGLIRAGKAALVKQV